MRRSIAPAIGVAAGFGIAAVAARRSRSQRDDFYEAPAAGAEAWEGGGTRVTLPITYHRSEQAISFHPVSLEAARAALPTDALHPVRLPDGRALLAVSAARYLEGTAPGEDARDLRYGEVMVAVLVTRAPSAPLVPIVRALLPGIGAPTFGAFLLYVAMTNRASRDTGRALGFPAFVGDLAFEDGIDERRLDLSDEGRQILQLRVASKGRITTDRRPMTMYSVLDDRLLETVCPCSGIAQQRLGPGSGRLELGDHPVADSLRELGLSPEALVSPELPEPAHADPVAEDRGHRPAVRRVCRERPRVGRLHDHLPGRLPDRHARCRPGCWLEPCVSPDVTPPAIDREGRVGEAHVPPPAPTRSSMATITELARRVGDLALPYSTASVRRDAVPPGAPRRMTRAG